jgi:hypothetical protein
MFITMYYVCSHGVPQVPKLFLNTFPITPLVWSHMVDSKFNSSCNVNWKKVGNRGSTFCCYFLQLGLCKRCFYGWTICSHPFNTFILSSFSIHAHPQNIISHPFNSIHPAKQMSEWEAPQEKLTRHLIGKKKVS